MLAKSPVPQTQNKYYLCCQLISAFLSVFINCIADVISVISFRFQPPEGEWESQALLFCWGCWRKPAHPSCVVCLGPTLFASVGPHLLTCRIGALKKKKSPLWRVFFPRGRSIVPPPCVSKSASSVDVNLTAKLADISVRRKS